MLYKSYYYSPIGKILLVSDEEYLIGVWIENQKYYLAKLDEKMLVEKETEVLKNTKKWLDEYFNMKKPNILDIKLSPIGDSFRQCVWDCLKEIEYGQTKSYGEIAKEVAIKLNKEKMSAQAVGNAVGHNPISIIIPCHRVVGKDGSLTGYAGGIENKIKLLELENVDTKHFFIPKKL